MTSELSRKNGCIKTDCIVALPCENKHPPKSGDGFCVWMVTETRRNAIEQKRVGGKDV
jgi:hypothetical protein